MELSLLPKLVAKRKKRLGQGLASGKGKTAGRGTKGQKARGKIKLSFEGGALPLIKRLPKLAGKGRNKPIGKKSIVVNLKSLKVLADNTVVDIDSLIKSKIVEESARYYGVKILGDGDVEKAYTVKLPLSKKAREKIEKAGGKVE